jgi:SAM-dependent methyltransferase
MKVYGIPVLGKLLIIDEAVRKAAQDLKKSPPRISDRHFKPLQRWEVYAPSNIFSLYHHIKRLDLLPYYNFADLGSGLGAACFAAALHFNNAIGFELNPHLCGKAEEVGQELGFDRVRFFNKDFIEADLSRYQVLYIFQPFFKGFMELTKKKMSEIASGTYVISNVYASRPYIFTEESFQLICPTPEETSDPQLARYYSYHNLCTYRRI